MTTIQQLQEIIETTRSFNSRDEKLFFLNKQLRDDLNFLSGNIKKDGIALAIASEIPNYNLTFSESTMESIILSFNEASKYSRKKDKIRIIQKINLKLENKKFVLTCLYGSLKLGLKIPIPDPVFGETIKCQLCGTGIEFDPSEMVIETKWDGIRCLATNNNGEIILQSRNGKILNIPVIAKALKNILPNGTTVDGEIIDKSGDFQKLDRKSNDLVYMIFDILYYKNQSQINYSLSFRKDFIKRYILENNHVRISQPLNLNNMNDIDEWIESTGAEGIVAKDLNSLYKYGDRKSWIKVKPFLDISGVIIKYKLGEGRRKNMIGAVEFLPDGFENTVFVGSGFTDQQLIEMKELIDNNNKIRIDVKYQNATTDNKSLRFPTFLRIREINDEEI